LSYIRSAVFHADLSIQNQSYQISVSIDVAEVTLKRLNMYYYESTKTVPKRIQSSLDITKKNVIVRNFSLVPLTNYYRDSTVF